ncbi:multicopper oxidase domain-containing protein [Jatrophihabitans telluris]|uniref:Multicopper oxidase domain-containing protein n=1 Tax=Jatrophihabitans telluris TaxID=2038343 RepID=A0ABY4QUP5_9ACTN|nr:multicopper oxidase domain-containing protein [Jatrophihabitans telluris]UQX87378.1 multicopper oxidase domain-containing protein [Jatrophihabitans telluris]
MRVRIANRRSPRRVTAAALGTTMAALSLVALQAGIAGAGAAELPATARVTAAGLRPAIAPVLGATTPTSVGRLTPRGCTGTGTVACDLYAKAGSTTMPGTVAAIPIWGFATDATSAVTAPGPVLVVNQGDRVTITLHNGLSGQSMSLALPGQQGVSGAGDDLTGAAAGSTAQYTFTASRPGTFTYEAGHTPQGARQVAMGLAGALIVLPSTAGSAYGNPADYPNTTYDDDAVLVLSEIDPALNTSPDPLAFDMRNFAPKYRLVNGHPFPSGTSSIATDYGHKVLVRYVNVGQQTHPMGALGTTQLEVAQDGHPAHYATTVAAESVDPGTTVDSIITMPGNRAMDGTVSATTPTKVGLYETNGSLDNAGALTGDTPAQVGFGGMLVFLDTQAPVNPGDLTGPTSKALTVGPNPSNALSDVTVTATVSDAATGSSAIAAAEYVIDDDAASPIAAASGVPMTLAATGQITTTATGTIPASVLADPTFAAGKHIVYVRAKDVQGNWGAVGSVVLNVPKTGPATTGGSLTPNITNGTVPIDISATGDDSGAGGIITDAEYFLDTPPASSDYGHGTAMSINRQASVVSVDATFDPASLATPLAEGVHHVYVHVKDDLLGSGLWGPVLDLPLSIDRTGPVTQGATLSPPATNGIQGDASNPGYLKLTAQLTDQGVLPQNIVDGEAFLSTVKADGTGLQLIAMDGKLDSPDEHVYALIPLSQIKAYKDGTLKVFVHGQDAAGNWGDATANPATLVIDRIAPKLTGLSGVLGPFGQPGVALSSAVTEANTLSAAEVWTTNTDPGVGKATPATLSVSNGVVTALASMPATAGAYNFHLRVRDQAGNWSNAVQATVSVFNSALQNTTGWSRSGSPLPSVSAAAKLPNNDEPGSTLGLPVNGSNTASAQFLASAVSSAQGYHARFRFAANTLNSQGATNTVTIFSATTATGLTSNTATNDVFSLQYQGSGNTAQIRGVLGTATTAWITIGTGPHTIGLDFKGGATSSLTLTMDGTALGVTGGATTAIRSNRLGFVRNGGTGLTSTGTAYFDSFFSVFSVTP